MERVLCLPESFLHGGETSCITESEKPTFSHDCDCDCYPFLQGGRSENGINVVFWYTHGTCENCFVYNVACACIMVGGWVRFIF